MAFTSQHLYFDDLEIGQEWQSAARTVTETDIVNFAGLSGDFNAIHVDHHFAKGTHFGKPIAHGVLGMAIASGLGTTSPAVRTLAFLTVNEWHFRAPIYIGDTVHVRTKVLSKEARGKGRRGIVTWQRQVVNQDGKVVQEGVTVTMVEGRGSASGGRQPAE